MPTTYTLQLKGYVGGGDFDRKTVDAMLAEQAGKRVNVLIDSLGGSLATGLSISAAFKNHGDVAVHFVGLNAPAATIALLGATFEPLRPPPTERNIIVFDDFVTTGSTMLAMKEFLQSLGYTLVFFTGISNKL